MVFRVSGYILDPKKEIFIGLTAIFGIGRKSAKDICKNLGIDYTSRIKDLGTSLSIQLTSYISQNYVTGDDLKREILNNKKKYILMNNYRGKRLRIGLPCRGQKTRSNARTCRMLHKKIS
ncbi:30S ribosomal protein S13 [uncultured bacterium]|nr:30S ribosomal protein S13 [uncultured bacterium]